MIRARSKLVPIACSVMRPRTGSAGGNSGQVLAAHRQGRGYRLIDIAKQLARAVKQGFTGDRELHVMRGLFQLLATDKLLETPNLSTQRRLQHVQTARGSAEVQSPGCCGSAAP